MGVKKLELTSPSRSERFLSVYGYTDYRLYLKDYYEFRKDGRHGYSYRAFSKAAGFASPNVLKLVIEGKRNIGSEAVEKFINALNLSDPMADYFRTLVKFNQAKTDTDKSYYFNILKKLTPQARRRDLCSESLRYLSQWLYPVIREMVELESFRDDPYWIGRRLNGRASLEEVMAALRFLIREGFIEKSDDGKYHATNNMIITSDEVKSLAIRNYHRQMLGQAEDALKNIPMEEREFGALTFVLPEAAMAELKYKLKLFRRELHTWATQVAEENTGEIVVQVNYQMYPHTNQGGGYEKEEDKD